MFFAIPKLSRVHAVRRRQHRRGMAQQQSEERDGQPYGGIPQEIERVFPVLQMPDLVGENGQQLPVRVLREEVVRDAEFPVPEKLQQEGVLRGRFSGFVIDVQDAHLFPAPFSSPSGNGVK